VSKDVPVHAKEASTSLLNAASTPKVEVTKGDTSTQSSSQSSVQPKQLKNVNSVSKDVPVHAKEASTSLLNAASKPKVECLQGCSCSCQGSINLSFKCSFQAKSRSEEGDTSIQPSSQSSVKPKKLKNLNRCCLQGCSCSCQGSINLSFKCSFQAKSRSEEGDTSIQPSSQSSVKPKKLKNLNSVSKDVRVHAKEASTSLLNAASKPKVEVKKVDTSIQPSSQSSVKPKKLKNLNRCVFFLSSTLRYEILLELLELIHKNIRPPLSIALLPLGKFSKSALCMEFSGTYH
ncbi:unnamed protein product, partial [Bemisia tabaci]